MKKCSILVIVARFLSICVLNITFFGIFGLVENAYGSFGIYHDIFFTFASIVTSVFIVNKDLLEECC
jgi:hypothetical protein